MVDKDYHSTGVPEKAGTSPVRNMLGGGPDTRSEVLEHRLEDVRYDHMLSVSSLVHRKVIQGERFDPPDHIQRYYSQRPP